MKERAINLHPHEARAAADGRLGLIVRPVVPQPVPFEPFSDPPSQEELEATGKLWWSRGGIHMEFWPCPLCQPGDRLWGREVWGVQEFKTQPKQVRFKTEHEGESDLPWAWRSPVTMPRWASRFTFEVFGVECRRVQYIGLDELKAGGIKDAVSVSDVWNHHYAKRGLGWDANPWAWFARVRRVEG